MKKISLPILLPLLFICGAAVADKAKQPPPSQPAPDFRVFVKKGGGYKLTKEVEKLDQTAIALVEKKKYREAVQVASQSLSMMPRNPRALSVRAFAELGLENYEGGLSDYEKAVVQDPTLREVLSKSISDGYARKGRKFTEKKDKMGALNSFMAATRWDPKNARPYTEMAFLAASERSYKACVDFAGKALELAPDDADALTHRGGCYNALAQFPAALQDLDAALKIRPDVASTLLNRASVHASMGHCAKAEADEKRALVRDPAFKSVGDAVLGQCAPKK